MLALVAGALAAKPHNGGAAWTRLSWMLGLRRMGLEVRFLEVAQEVSSADFFNRTLEDFGLEGILLKGHPTQDIRWEQARQWASQCSFLLNITGHLRQPELLGLIDRKVYLDLDPGYTQIWHQQGHDLGLPNHDLHFTVGENIGKSFCPIPTGGLRWIPIRQPSLLDLWPPSPSPQPSLFTTVASWRSPSGSLQHDSVTYGQKVHEFRRFRKLPRMVEDAQFELALDIHPGDEADRTALLRRGWRLSDARRLSTPQLFRRYLQNSGAEFSVAQGVYAHTDSGWFSDRTVRYLSSGRPALVQDTGIVHNIPSGDGLLTFRTLEEASDGVRRIVDDYSHHSLHARRLAESHFDSDKILTAFLERIDP